MDVNKYGQQLFSEGFVKDPYPYYSQLRVGEPVYKTRFPDGQQGWLITGYTEAVEALKEPRFIKDFSKLYGGSMDGMSVFTQNMLFSDPPDHRRLRGLAQKAFTPRVIEGMKERIEEITDQLLNDMKQKEEINLIDDFAFPLPIIVICEILGVPSEDRDKFRIWSNSLIEGSSGEPGVSIYQHMNDFIRYLGEWFSETRREPKNDLISKLIAAEEAGDRLTEKELYGLVTLLIIAGHETTVNLIGNSFLNLLKHPEQKELLRRNPELIDQAIEESLRFDGPVEFSTSRWASENLQFAGKEIRRGELVVVALNAANRDPDKFQDPNVFDISQEKSPHLAFGTGIHHCLGAPLARLEGKIAISKLLERFPNLRLRIPESELEWRPGMIVRGVKEIPVTEKNE
ncbi:cytochrome P450 family protein [Planococcus halotolerans]|uniref:Cytochrome P450 n=1 Tax=Planococcus halotolerans TaxID=2233542 RepID=A0A365KPP1_9BACL|nr:cytochrome P450 [Planococcus halotolerans]QHJ71931.1 cytochrome P450 [Planococcus halotolerans]RAZ74692.1 cytochrome P450 [Planococcus halotolerans]